MRVSSPAPGSSAAEVWAALADNIVTVTPGWSEAYGLFLEGEADMALSYTTSPAYHVVVDKKTNYLAAPFRVGHYLQVEVAARLKAAPNPALAEKFMKFVLSPGFQAAVPTGNWMFPAARGTEVPKAFGDLHKPARSLLLSSETVRDNRKAWVDEWLAAMAR